jgi:thioredoxin reductase (NADPH)
VQDIRIVDAGNRFRVGTSNGGWEARTVVVCVGSSLRRLGIDGEAEFEGRGLSRCATCDGPLFRGRDVAVIGGGDSAVSEALVLSEFASTVTLIHRGNSLGGQHVLRERLVAAANVAVRPGTEVVRLEGDGQVQRLVLRDAGSGAESTMNVGGVFAFVGLEPNTAFLKDVVDLDAAGHVVTDLWMGTSVPGLFAAGDVRQHSAAQFVSAAGDGATAAIAAHHRYMEARETAHA